MLRIIETSIDGLLDSSRLKLRGSAYGYLLAALIVAVAFAARLAIAPVQEGLPFLTFCTALTLTAVVCGTGPALFAAAACSLIASYFFLPPYQAFPLTFLARVVWPNVVFAAEALLILSVVEALSRQRAHCADMAALLAQIKTAKQELQVSAAAFETTEGIMITDASGVILRVNQAFTEITGYSAEEIVGKNPRVLKSGRHDAAFYAKMWGRIAQKGSWAGEIWDRRKNGEVYPKWMTITAIKSAEGAVTHYVASQSDITEFKRADDEIRTLAFYDALTKLPNRRLLLDRIRQAIASCAHSGRGGAIMFVDLDRFKSLNDAKGHDFGDLLLQRAAERLLGCVRSTDTLARHGGDEFVVMLTELDADSQSAAAHAEFVASKILRAMDEPFVLHGAEYRCSASIGIALFDRRSAPDDDLLRQADIAMYQAKAAGRNAMRFFDPHMQKAINARVEMERELRHAIERNQLALHYQVQVDADFRPFGAEALLRWNHPKLGEVPPDLFIAVAEESTLIHEIGEWVVDQACRQLSIWAKADETRDLILAVNVSAHQFRSQNFVEVVDLAIRRHRVRSSRLKLELTESVILHDIDATVARMHALKALNVRLSLDDFGTGYSSLAYLKRLPIDQIKIDRSFVRDIVDDANDALMVKAIIDMAGSFHLSVIAEGVETSPQLSFLRHNGCTAFQGYLFGKPVPIDRFDVELRGRLTGATRALASAG